MEGDGDGKGGTEAVTCLGPSTIRVWMMIIGSGLRHPTEKKIVAHNTMICRHSVLEIPFLLELYISSFTHI
jgi:hypothetical protein